jgi:histidine ammonia-lyase
MSRKGREIQEVTIGEIPVSLPAIIAVARRGAPVVVSEGAAFLNQGITPVIPSEGSVGASGDLTPLSYLVAALAWIRPWVEIETNSANDNPLFDAGVDHPLMGGNFYGGRIAFAMDALKPALASATDMADRQVALLVNPNVNRGLPADLVRVTGAARLHHHGFKAITITASALTAEALKATMPAASFSRSTESHNQDKVSMGTIATRDAAWIYTLAERVVAIHLMAAAQACEIRGRVEVRSRLASLVKKTRRLAAPTFEDPPMDADIEALAQRISTTGFPGEG